MVLNVNLMSIEGPNRYFPSKLHPLIRLDALVPLPLSLKSRPDCLVECLLVPFKPVVLLLLFEINAEDVTLRESRDRTHFVPQVVLHFGEKRRHGAALLPSSKTA